MQFKKLWRLLCGGLHVGNVIPRWTRDSGFLDNPIFITKLRPWAIEITTPSVRRSISIPREDFEKVWALWKSYLQGRVSRREIRNLTRHSAYIISILYSVQVFWLGGFTPNTAE